MSGFSNRASDIAPLTRESFFAAAERTLEAVVRLDPMRAWGADQKVPVPVHVYELLAASEYEQFERELAEHLEDLP